MAILKSILKFVVVMATMPKDLRPNKPEFDIDFVFLYNRNMKNVAIVTGASSGLGKEFTNQIEQKFDYDEIWIFARRESLLLEVENQINEKAGKKIVKSFAVDICGKDGVKRFSDILESEKDFSVGLFVNNAGFGTYGPFEDTPLDKELDMIEINCVTLTGLCGVVLKYLASNSVIINTASLAAFMPLGNFAVYGASKAYALSFSVALAAELKDKGVKVCALCPGSVSTEFANVASNGARKEVKGGIEPDKVVAHCLKRAFKGKKIAMYRFKWKFTALLGRFVGRYLVARYTYKYNKRPYQYN